MELDGLGLQFYGSGSLAEICQTPSVTVLLILLASLRHLNALKKFEKTIASLLKNKEMSIKQETIKVGRGQAWEMIRVWKKREKEGDK